MGRVLRDKGWVEAANVPDGFNGLSEKLLKQFRDDGRFEDPLVENEWLP